MNNNFLSNRAIIWIICVLILLIILTLISGCKSLPFFGGGQNNINISPNKPVDQLWDAVKKSNWLSWLAIPIIALGAVAMFNGMGKLGISAIIFGSVNLFMTLATARFALIMAICGLIGSIASVAISIFIKNKALKEIVCGVQNIKKIAKENGNSVPSDKIKEMLSKQVKSTQKIVQQIKSALKIKGEI